MSKCTTPPWIVDTSDDGQFSGENWLVCSIGRSNEDDKHYYVTTDHVHASELDGDAKYDAGLIAAAPCMGKALLRLWEMASTYKTANQLTLSEAETALRKAGIIA